ncbi:MAG TPA: transcription elongation factor GreA [Thermoleophilaceae bacterium]|nr:transcription elongation factor GreA [Thermoleophilaceae bacterium]
MSDTVKMTEAARRRLEADVEKLEGEGRREKAERIGIARDWGDLKENAEYHAAKNDAAMLEAKIARMRGQLRSAEIVEAVEGDAIGMGSTVTYADSESGKEMTFTLVPATEADPGDGRLSMDSPVGEALAGAREGDERKLETPRGARSVRVVAIEQP